MNPRKIVFVLGAGFSVDAGGPKQSDILKGVLALNNGNTPDLRDFLNHIFGHEKNIPLEDIYTALDRSIVRNESLRKYGTKELLYIRDKFEIEVAKYFAKLLNRENLHKAYVDRFARILIKWRVAAGSKDEIAVVSTNWDLLLDNSLGLIMETDRDLCWKDEKRQVFIDYCVMDKQLQEQLNIPASLTIKAMGLTNFKLLKPHGSLNWLKCPNCDSLFVEFGEKLASNIESGLYECRICVSDANKLAKLRPFLLSPTFLKDLSNVHYKSIWSNAGFELNEARHIVFVGYSFPLADYEIRYLMTRHVDHEAKISVVTYSDCDGGDFESQKLRDRYRDFFGPRVGDGDFYFEGARKYFESMPEEYDAFVQRLEDEVPDEI